MLTRRLLRLLAALVVLVAAGSVAPASPADAETVSDDCDDGININEGTILGFFVKVKLAVPAPGALWVCYRVDHADPAIHEGGKLALGSGVVVDDQYGYCAGKPDTHTDAEGTVGPDRIPVLIQRLVPPAGVGEHALCIRIGDAVKLRISTVIPGSGLEQDTA